ncbi:TfuA-like protein [Streptomyces melanogenes]|uniref:TfuA-like protein n=1 Tax=Streptomyces melanogenes TaxID=67326 RepID=A0ABZ1XL77_9ACTN|nr:TfuA-like protein [Streptomyces melanogenes]
MSVHVFVGPTLPPSRIRELCPHAVVHPPVRHGDLFRLDPAAGDTVLIIDGLWHQSAPVRHKEILVLLADGGRVIGAASMGALRAAELAAYGMTGVGRIFDDFRTGALNADDEVAVLQDSDGRALTLALVNVRAALERAHADQQVTNAEAVKLLRLARAIPYARRTWAMLDRTAAQDEALADALGRLDRWRRTHPYDLKREDAEQALALIAADPGQVTASTCARQILHATIDSATEQTSSVDADGWRAQPWVTSFVRYWDAAFRPGPGRMPLLAALNHQQLYDPGFPARWRHRVLAAIAGRAATPKAGALAIANACGVNTADMRPEQLAFWLTPAEQRDLTRADALTRIMVRCARWDGAWAVWPSTWGEAAGLLGDPVAAAAAVTAAFKMNARAEAADARHSIAHLDTARISRHLAEQWRLPPSADQAERDAAARDRALRDFAGAVEVARAYYLAAVSAAGATSSDSVSRRT